MAEEKIMKWQMLERVQRNWITQIAAGNVKWHSYSGNSYTVFYKTKPTLRIGKVA
jgi:hypothetical protein